ncbi:hypothetical protein OROHE_006070 [Orobanche hederae]
MCVAETQDVGNRGGQEIQTGIVLYREPFASAGLNCRGVKGRTVAGGRKAKVITPPMTTPELIKHTEKPVVDCDAYVGTSTKVRHNIKLKNGLPHLDCDYWAMIKISGHLRSIITVRWSEDQERGVRPMSEVTLEDLIAILHHENISNRVINSWADLLKHKFAETDLGRYTTIFSSTCWELVAERDTNERKTLKHFFDDMLEESIENDFLIFPLWMKSDGKPREGGGKDVHLGRAKILRKIKEIYGRSNPGVVFTKPKVMAYLQQEATSVDCGVVVCSIIKNLLSGKWMKSGTMTHASVGNFRKKMVEQFMVSPFFVKKV